MDAYTFTAMPANGMVTLPETFANKLVEITVREVESKNFRKRDMLSPVEIDTRGMKWTREDANERR
jgi:hypothetical protein